jgi:hypothetical protein
MMLNVDAESATDDEVGDARTCQERHWTLYAREYKENIQ